MGGRDVSVFPKQNRLSSIPLLSVDCRALAVPGWDTASQRRGTLLDGKDRWQFFHLEQFPES